MNIKKLGTILAMSAMAAAIFLGQVHETEAAKTQEEIEKLLTAEDNIASGTVDEEYGQIFWVIDKEGKLTVIGTGDVCKPMNEWLEREAMPWSGYRREIVSIEMNVVGMTDASRLFEDCFNVTSVDFSNFDTSQITSMFCMFSSCWSLESLDLSNFDTSQVSSMRSMFYNCTGLKSIDLQSFDTAKVKEFQGMFLNCSKLQYLDLSSFVTNEEADISYMFEECIGLKRLDIRNFNISDKTTVENMFNNCPTLKKVYLPYSLMKRVIMPYRVNHEWKTIDGKNVSELAPELTGSTEILCMVSDSAEMLDVLSDVYHEWYEDYIRYVYNNDLMTGIGETDRFEPNGNITKAQVAQVLYNINPSDIGEGKVFQLLKDVYSEEWYATAVDWAYEQGIITGDTNTNMFYPNENVTREELALMLYRYAGCQNYDISKTSTLEGLKNAENVSNWASDGVKWAVGSGLISGIETNGVKDLSPKGNATRAQMAAILMRFCETYQK